MQDGEIVQIGTPVELFERPAHTFVGHFIGSPGMNVLPCEVKGGGAFFAGDPISLEGPAASVADGAAEIGIRPEFVSVSSNGHGLAARVRKVADVGRHKVVEAIANESRIHAIIEGDAPNAGDQVNLEFKQSQTRLYKDGWLASTPGEGVQ